MRPATATPALALLPFALLLGACDSLNPFAEEDGAIVVTPDVYPDARWHVLVSDSTGQAEPEPYRAFVPAGADVCVPLGSIVHAEWAHSIVPAADSVRVRLYMHRIWRGGCKN